LSKKLARDESACVPVQRRGPSIDLMDLVSTREHNLWLRQRYLHAGHHRGMRLSTQCSAFSTLLKVEAIGKIWHAEP